MAPKLYMIDSSPPVRSVLMAAKSLGVDLEFKEINLQKGEQKSPEYLKINPQHTVPTLVDDGFILWDSHAIMTYLVSKYAKDDSLYPKDIETRALVDQRLHFDGSVTWNQLYAIAKPIIYKGRRVILEEDRDCAEEVFGMVERFLEGRLWIAGDNVTVADFSFLSSLSAFNVFVRIDPVKFPKVVSYLRRGETLQVYKDTQSFLDNFEKKLASFIPELLSKK